jgi:hypothetical protein
MELQSIPPNISAHTHLWRILFSGLVRGQLTELEKTDLFLIPVHAHSQEKYERSHQYHKNILPEIPSISNFVNFVLISILHRSSDPFARLLQAESVTCHSIQRMDSFQEVCRQWNVFALSLQSRTAQKSACTKKLREEHDFLVEQLRAYNNGCLSRGIYSKSVDVVRKALNSAVAEANKALKQHEVTRRYLESNFEKVDKITKELAQLKAGLTLKFEKIQAQRMEVEMWKEKLKDEFKDEWFS